MKILIDAKSSIIDWYFAVPDKKDSEYKVEYFVFAFVPKDGRRRGVEVWISKGEFNLLKSAMKKAEKYYKEKGEPKWKKKNIASIEISHYKN